MVIRNSINEAFLVGISVRDSEHEIYHEYKNVFQQAAAELTAATANANRRGDTETCIVNFGRQVSLTSKFRVDRAIIVAGENEVFEATRKN